MTPVLDTAIFAAERTASNYIVAAAVVVLTAMIAVLMSRLLAKVLTQAGLRKGPAKIVARVLAIIVVFIGIIYALDILDVAIGPIFGAFGFSSVIVAFAFQGIITNFVSSTLLHAREPFRAGDQIETGGFAGTVLEINSRDVVLLTFDGNQVIIPSSDVLSNPIHNMTADPIRRSQIMFQVPYRADLRLVQATVGRAVRHVESVLEMPAPDVFVESFDDSGIGISVRFWHPSEQLTTNWVRSEATLAIDGALREIGVEVPYPHVVLASADDQPEPPNAEPTSRPKDS